MPDVQASTAPTTPTTPPGASEDALDARAAASGDSRALARLYQRHARMVHAIALLRVDRTEAEDVTHDVFLRAMKSIGTLTQGEVVGPWLAQIARNAAVDRAKSQSRFRWFLKGSASQPSQRGSNAREAGLSGDDVLRAIRSLPEAYHETLVLRLVEQMTGPQISAALGLTHGSVRVNLHRGMELLRTQLGKPIAGGGA